MKALRSLTTQNWSEFFKKQKEQRNELGSLGFIYFDSCNLHIVHGAFKTGAKASGWKLKKLLKSCFQLLNDSYF